MNMKIVPVIIGVAISVILCATVLVPVIHDSTYDSVNQESFEYFATNKLGEYVYDFSAEGITFNGQPLGSNTVTMSSEHFKIQHHQGVTMLFDASLGVVVSITQFTLHTNGDYSYVSSGTEATSTTPISKFVGVCDKGDYVVSTIPTSKTLHANPSDTIYIVPYGNIGISSDNYIIFGEGTYDNLPLVGYTKSGSSWVASSGAAYMAQPETSEDYASFNVKAAVSFSTYTNPSTSCCVYIPATYEVSEDSPYMGLIEVIPVFVILALVVMAASVIANKP